MEFEFDKRKSQINKKKQGIDFIEAQALWNDPDRIEIPANTIDEVRFLVISKIFDKHWSAIITYRKEKIRIISARRSRREEIEIYES
jgi:uncharacterized DUF497 family protein